MKHWIGWGLLLWGIAGMYDQFQVAGLASGTLSGSSSLPALPSWTDPAALIGLPASTSYFSAGMMTDAGVALLGAWLAFT